MLIKFDIKKIFNRKTIIATITIVTIYLISIIVTNRNFTSNIYNDFYFEVYEIVNGAYSVENEAYIISLRDEIYNSETEVNNLYAALKNEEIDYQEYLTEVSYHNKILENKNGVDAIFEHYQTIKTDTENRYMMIDNDWNKLLYNEDLDFFLIFLLIILIVPVFGNEYKNRMCEFLTTTKNGRRKLFIIKMLISFAICASCVAIIYGMELLFFLHEHDAEQLDYPIQSIRAFIALEKNISIGGGIISIFINKLIGTIFLSFIIHLLFVILKSTIPVCFIATLFSILPYFVLPLNLKYIIVNPCGFLIGKSWIIPNSSYFYTNASGEQITIWITKETDTKTLLILYYFSFLIFIMIYLVSKHVYTKKQS